MVEATTVRKEGSQIHNNSLFTASSPNRVKKCLIPIGETRMGVHGKKYRVLSKGDNRAIPNPPFVNASEIP